MTTRKLLESSSTQAQLFRYIFVAGFGLIIDFSTIIFAKEVLGFHYLLAACAGFLAGLTFTFLYSNKYVFGQPKSSSRTRLFILFGVIGLVGLIILNILMWLMTGLLGINYIVSKALATIAVFMWNFFARKNLYKDEAAKNIPYEL